MNALDALLRIFYRPREVFTALREDRFWVLAAFILVTLVVIQGLCMSLTMTRGFTDETRIRVDSIRVYPHAKTDQKPAETKKLVLSSRASSDRIDDFSPGLEEDTIRTIGAKSLLIGLSVILPVVYLLIALVFDTAYFRIVGTFMQLEYDFGDWFSFSIWSRIPATSLATIATFVAVLALGEQSDSNHYQILSFAWWISIPSEGSRGLRELIFQLDAALLWIIVLQVIGFRRWSGRNVLSSLVIVVAPAAIVYGFAVFFLLSELP